MLFTRHFSRLFTGRVPTGLDLARVVLKSPYPAMFQMPDWAGPGLLRFDTNRARFILAISTGGSQTVKNGPYTGRITLTHDSTPRVSRA